MFGRFDKSRCPTCRVKLEKQSIDAKGLLASAAQVAVMAAAIKYKWGGRSSRKVVSRLGKVHEQEKVYECPICGFERMR